jgi:hypothetical protein
MTVMNGVSHICVIKLRQRHRLGRPLPTTMVVVLSKSPCCEETVFRF